MNNSTDTTIVTTTFTEMGLPSVILTSLEGLNFTVPTPIQAQAIPLALTGRDILGSASTGTGKTLAFALPMIAHLLKNQEDSALILCPTRELAQQVAESIRQVLGKKASLRISLLIGGDSFVKQRMHLRNSPRIIVGTPGRTIDHFEQGTLDDQKFTFLVLDEMDRMFDMGFSGQIEQIIKQIPAERQTLMFSATLPAKIAQLAGKYLRQPERISVNSGTQTALNITQETVNVKDSEKYNLLVQELGKREGSIIIFVKTKHNTERLAKELSDENHSVSAIHGDLRQNKRERVMAAFRKGRYRIMVATDVAARGLDVPHIQHVINYDLPHAPEDYIHRIGRTARAGASGFALNFVNGEDRKRWHAIQRLINPEFANSAEGRESERSERFGDRGGRSGGFSRSSSRGGSSDRFSRPRSDRFGSDRGGDRGNSRFGGDRERSPRRSFSENSEGSSSSRSSFGGDRPARTFDRDRSSSYKPAFNKDSSGGFKDKPRSSFWDKDKSETGSAPRSSFGSDRPARSFDRSDRSSSYKPADKPRSSFWDKEKSEGGFKERAPRSDWNNKSEGRSFERPARPARRFDEYKKD